MITRQIEPHLKRIATKFPVVTITGPRQSGKTTLVKHAFPDKPYQNLEDPETRRIAQEDPRRFFSQFPEGAVLDEVQRVPDLLSYIQTIVDNADQEGMFILTGSARFDLLNTVSQSLAGRTAMLKLLPFSVDEIGISRVDDMIFTGFYPRIHHKNLNPAEASSFYIHTYIERDVRSLLHIRDMSRFNTFLRLCAARTGQILNLSSLGNDCGINHNTAASWLSMLEASFIIFRLQPHFNNLSKRLIKAPKIYFYDCGLASYLLGIKEPSHVTAHPLRGNLFETLVVSEIVKKRFNAVKEPDIFYFRDNVGNEVDILAEEGAFVRPIEIKSGATFSSDMLKGLDYYTKINSSGSKKTTLIYSGDSTFEHKGHAIVSINDLKGFTI